LTARAAVGAGRGVCRGGTSFSRFASSALFIVPALVGIRAVNPSTLVRNGSSGFPNVFKIEIGSSPK